MNQSETANKGINMIEGVALDFSGVDWSESVIVFLFSFTVTFIVSWITLWGMRCLERK